MKIRGLGRRRWYSVSCEGFSLDEFCRVRGPLTDLVVSVHRAALWWSFMYLYGFSPFFSLFSHF